MADRPDTIARRIATGALAACGALAITILMTWPLATNLGGLGRTSDGGDGLYSVWNVAWVARTLLADPRHLYDANIFFPHRDTLAYSEANIGAGVIAVPAWWLTRNPYTAHNVALLAAFAGSVLGMWLLVRRLTGDPRAAAVAGVMFAFCPYLQTHTAHIQLLMAGGLPLSMLMFHRLVDAPSRSRAVALGLTLAAQALSCAYYGIFAGLMVGYGVLVVAALRKSWRNPAYWSAVALAAAVSIVCVLPFFLPYIWVQRDLGFSQLRSLQDAVRYSSHPQDYVASPAPLHRWMLAATAGWTKWEEVLFPGFLALGFAAAGLVPALRRDDAAGHRARRETAMLYGSLGLLAFWSSFGPAAGLYAVLFRLPLFSFLRAPSRLGLIVVLAVVVFAAIGMSRLLARLAGPVRVAAAAALGAAVVAELAVLPFPWEPARKISPVYAVLARLPRATVAEFPFYGDRGAFHLHTQYMLFSTTHWMPLANGYSDVFPPDFRTLAPLLASFPSKDTFDALRKYRVRYIVIHWDGFVVRKGDLSPIEERRRKLEPFLPYLRPVASDGDVAIYEILGFP
jgi:hypothetical protein